MLEVLQRGIDALPPKQQTAIILYYLHGYSLAEAAEIADCNVGTMKSRLHYALKALRSLLPVERRAMSGVPPTLPPMTCRKARRELLERFRFGEELDARSAPHLEHLQTCLECRDEVGLDRALVAQLRRALRARVEGYDPSPSSWQLVRERALAAEGGPSLWTSWFGRLTGGLRAAGAVAAVALVVMLGTIGNGNDDVAAFQLRATGRGEIPFSDRCPRIRPHTRHAGSGIRRPRCPSPLPVGCPWSCHTAGPAKPSRPPDPSRARSPAS